MKQKGILFFLIQLDEAHSSAWPVALQNQPEPQKNIEERLERANLFNKNDSCPFPVFSDTWQNDFGETYHAWPDVYYVFGQDLKITNMSTYMTTHMTIHNIDALIDIDCTDLIEKMLK